MPSAWPEQMEGQGQSSHQALASAEAPSTHTRSSSPPQTPLLQVTCSGPQTGLCPLRHATIHDLRASFQL